MKRPLVWLIWLAVALSTASAFGAVSITTTTLGSGVVGTSYTAGLGATGGTAPYTFSASGLPANLGVNGSQITGIPTSAGTFSVDVTVTDSATPKGTATKTLSLTINPAPLSVTTSSLGAGVVGTAYTANLGATGGVSPYTFSASGLPAGLGVNGSQITGTPTTAGTSSVTITVTDSATPGNTATKTLSLTINTPSLSVTTASLGAGVVGTAYTASLGATGGVSPYTFSATGLPAGLSVNGSQISGIPTAAGTSSVTITVTDSATPANTATKALSLTINAPALSITTSSLASGTVGSAYTALLSATGGTSPYTFSASGLPAGLSVSGNQIVGTPQNAGTASVTITASDSATPSNSATKTLSLVIANPPLTLTTSNLADGTVGSPYSTTLGASGGTGSYTFSGTGLPSGLSVSGNQISGSPSASGTFNVTLQVKDSASPANTASNTVQLKINNAPVTIGTTSLPNGTVGAGYSQSLTASGGTGTFTWAITSGALPPGLGLSGNQITGTPTTAGPTTFTVKATDTANASSTQALGITINPAPVTVTTSALANGTVGSAYSATLAAAGGNGTYTFSLANGSLPAGLTLAGNLISGTPTAAGSSTFTVKAADTTGSSGTQPLTITVDPAPVNLVTSSLANGTVGTSYLQSLSATGGTGAYVYSLISGSLPAGLTLSGNQITGTPSSPGTANFSIKVADAANPNAFATKSLAVTIFAGLTIATCPSSSGTVGQAYSAGLSGSGGIPPYQWSLGSGQLPPGLALDGGSGQIGGTPTQAGSFSFNIKLNDSGGSSANQNCSITVAAALTIGQGGLADGSQGSNYSQTLSASGGQPPYTWTLAGGSLPPGVSLGNGGQLIGVPSAAGSFSFTVRVADTAGASATGNFSIRISAGLSIGSCPTASALPNLAYSSTITGAGGQPPYTFSIAGQLPAGLTLDGRTGAISGTPTQSGAVSFTIALSDAASTSVTKPCSIVVSQAVVVNSAALPPTTVGANYSQQVAASGGTPPYTWSIVTGTLPPGLSLSAGGQISGSATASGSFPFVVRAADSAGGAATANLSILVAGSIAIGTCPAPIAISGQGYNGLFSVTGGQPPYSFSVSSGILPTGVRLNSTAGTLSGAPVDLGNYNYSVQVVDKTGAQGSISCSITVTAGLSISNTFVADATVRSQYSQVLQAIGGQAPYSWSISLGALPPGLALNISSGLISGTPTGTGAFPFTALVNDSGGASVQKQFSITVSAGLVISACPSQVGELDFSYAASVNAAGGSPPYSFSTTGTLPAGLSFDPTANAITGTPTQSGSFPFKILVSDKAGANVNRDCTLDVRAAVRIVNDTLPTGAGGAAYLATLSASGGVPPYTWSTSAGALPPGLFLNAGTGQISGTPTISGNYSFLAQITDSIGAQSTKNFSIPITQGLAIVDCPTPAAILGLPYNASLTTVGGNAPFTWTISVGALPPGLTLQSDAALVSGSANQLGQYSFTLRVDDATARSSIRSCSIQVSTGNLGVTTNPTLPAALTGVSYSQSLGASGGSAPYTWVLRDGKLPDGITLDSNGKLTGTASAPGSYQFTIELTDADGNSMRQIFTLVVQPGTAPVVRITGLPDIIAPAQQPLFDLQLDSAYGLPITGTITLTFVADSDVQANDPAIQFATGGRTINFNIAANSTKVTFAAPIAALQTGTVAGTITLTVKLSANGTDITPTPAPSRSIRVDRLAPKITSVSVVKNASGVTLNIIGYSTTRDVTQGTFRFTTSGGTTTDVTVPVSDGAKAWFQSSGSAAFGGQFSLAQPFTFQGGTPAITSIAVTLTNGQGVSAPATVNF